MASYISLLRGVNVGGKKKLLMAELRECLEGLGFSHVRSYIQSGNLVLQSAARSPATVSKQVSAAILEQFGLEVPVITRRASQWTSLIENNPYLAKSGIEASHLHVTFLSGNPKASGLKQVASRAVEGESIHLIGEELYMHLPHGSARTKLDNSSFQRYLGVEATTRNWRTVNKLGELSVEG
ncbi:MAG: hypothetical protein ACI9F9_000328 [Candidatus Paceibacteria bacterium]|jgi:uncharacterized protein (DUF1697 family)